jgi:hypothetical protein
MFEWVLDSRFQNSSIVVLPLFIALVMTTESLKFSCSLIDWGINAGLDNKLLFKISWYKKIFFNLLYNKILNKYMMKKFLNITLKLRAFFIIFCIFQNTLPLIFEYSVLSIIWSSITCGLSHPEEDFEPTLVTACPIYNCKKF